MVKKGSLSRKSAKKGEEPVKGIFRRHPEWHKGIKTLVGYTILLGFVYLIFFLLGLFGQRGLFFEKLVQSYTILIIDFIMLVMLLFVVYGLVARKVWGWSLALAWFSLSILHTLFSLFMIRKSSFALIKELVIIAGVFIIVVNVLIIWYLLHKKDYFHIEKHIEEYGSRDKAFVYLLISLWIVLLLISLTIGIRFYDRTTYMADTVVKELEGASMVHSLIICEQKDGEERDICYVVLISKFKSQDLSYVCTKVESEFYKIACNQALPK